MTNKENLNYKEAVKYISNELLQIGYPKDIVITNVASIDLKFGDQQLLDVMIEILNNGIYIHFSNGNTFEDVKNKNESLQKVIDRTITSLHKYYHKGAVVKSIYKFGKMVEQKLVIDGDEEGWIKHAYFFIPFAKKVTKVSKIPAVKDMLESKN